MFESNAGNQCPYCGQFKIEHRSVVKNIAILASLCTILVITLPLDLFLIPALIVSLFMPSKRKSYRFCRNCKWNENAQPAPAA